MLIKNIYLPGTPNQLSCIGIKDDNICQYYSDELELDFNGALAFPGLINSHDHLEFNLFPKLGNKIYDDYVEWGNDIHEKNNKIIETIKKVPYELRFKWGLYKNLLCGVTTVAHHGNGMVYKIKGMPDIINNYNYLHSVRLESMWKIKLNLLLNDKPFILHIGEGTNIDSRKEIIELIKWNIMKKKIIGVHGVSLDEEFANNFIALVWCPDSNFFLYNRIANVNKLKNATEILFGSDSTLSSDWNIWNHIRLARSMDYLSDLELYESLSSKAAKIWGLHNKGSISENKIADIVISKSYSENNWNNYYNTNPENILLILKAGKIALIDKEYDDRNSIIKKANFDLIAIHDVGKYVFKGLKNIAESIPDYIPDYKFPFTILS